MDKDKKDKAPTTKDMDEKIYPVEPFEKDAPPTQENIDEALEEENPSEDTMDDTRG